MSTVPPQQFEAFQDYSSFDYSSSSSAPTTIRNSTTSASSFAHPAANDPTKALLGSTSPPLDFFPYTNPGDLHAPQPDQFESDIDSTFLSDNTPFDDSQLQLLSVDPSEAFAFLRTETPTSTYQYRTGPGSVVSVSTESASGYDSLSAYSESFLPPHANTYSYPSLDAPLDLDMEFNRLDVNSISKFAAGQQQQPQYPLSAERRLSYGLPSSPPLGHEHDLARRRSQSGARSDYMPSQRQVIGSGGSDYYPTLSSHSRHPSLVGMPHGGQPGRPQQRTVSPSSVSPSSATSSSDHAVPITPPIALVPGMHASLSASLESQHELDMANDDPRKKYRCPSCPRAFARAFNLKTHMATHDPNRPKPHVCPHKACGRSFSRKHDLGRHLVSIHRDEYGMAHANGLPLHQGPRSDRSERGIHGAVGVENGPRGWCESCGKGWVGRDDGCQCNIK